MQDQLVNNNILKPEERIPTEPVVSHPQNMNHLMIVLRRKLMINK